MLNDIPAGDHPGIDLTPEEFERDKIFLAKVDLLPAHIKLKLRASGYEQFANNLVDILLEETAQK